MKYYIEYDMENRVITKAITTDDADLLDFQIEVSEEQFNQIIQYQPSYINIVELPTVEERLMVAEDMINFLLDL